ncbi:DNA cytosine methyltransferase [Oceaniovalibus sp. ACAM 378]|uniref:DNA cytosine methyltransferase n=1 Tax=Oceaniovalibus sp. ACAM 378 TaxID=2599923 RepID=UPI0011D61B72|nr:DNA cytosine methyltransferase [Oceaniovalibus sp. ACAM 378]TYB89681.1 DNA methyltransferase [Oceaniovalibus sp. ACAM 378]
MLDATQPMIIDSFAGGGGASTGIELALGRSPDVAINHNAAALALHAVNHPETLHLDSNIWDVAPLDVTKGRHVGLLWASPDCKHFSKAKGGAPKDRNVRDLAWVVVDWAEQVKPDVILMENVEEFLTWGPLGEDGQPMKEFAGMTFELWIKRLRKAGYRVQWRELRACDYGAPTIRKRFFMVARRDGLPITWPKPTHGDPKSAPVKCGKLLPWRTAADCIDWSLPCPSIFDTGPQIMEKHGLRAVRPLAKNTMARVARGMKRYVLDSERPFIVNLTHGARTEDIADPFRTITGANRGEKAVVAPSITRFNGGATGQDLREPMATVTANSFIKRPGGAAPLGLIAPSLATYYGHGGPRGTRTADLSEPLRAVTVGNRHALIAPCLMSLKGTARRASGADTPHPTVLAGGGHSALIAPLMATMRNSQKPWQGCNQPAHTITAGGAGLTVIAPVLTYAQQGGRCRSVDDPHHTICASSKDQNAVIAPMLIQTGYGEAPGQAPRSLDIGAPLGTVVAGGVKHAAAAAFLAQHHTGATGHDARDPFSTVAATGSHQTPVAAWFAKYYGTGDGARTDDPMHTITVKDRMGHMQAALSAPPFTADHAKRAREVADFMRAHDAWDDREFVTLDIGDATYVITDIGMRMLTPRELFHAQGFPPDYVIEGHWTETADKWVWHPFSKSVQVSCCGNSVCPPLAEALVRANCKHLVEERIAA